MSEFYGHSYDTCAHYSADGNVDGAPMNDISPDLQPMSDAEFLSQIEAWPNGTPYWPSRR